MKRYTIPLRVLLVLALIQCCIVISRTTQVVREALRYERSTGEPFPEGIADAAADLHALAWQERWDLLRPGMTCDEALDPSLDYDNDGLTGLEEARQLTSDRFPDSDEDGVPDGEDHCPNCTVRSYRGLIESHVISEHLRGWCSGTVYVVTSDGQELEVDCPNGTAVVVGETGFHHIFFHTDWVPSSRGCAPVGYIQGTSRVFVPGAFFVFAVLQDFGGLCSREDLVFVVDVPFWGPVTVGQRNIWIS